MITPMVIKQMSIVLIIVSIVIPHRRRTKMMETSDNNATDETNFAHNSVKNIDRRLKFMATSYIRYTQCGACNCYNRNENMAFTSVLHIPYCSQYCKEMVV